VSILLVLPCHVYICCSFTLRPGQFPSSPTVLFADKTGASSSKKTSRFSQKALSPNRPLQPTEPRQTRPPPATAPPMNADRMWRSKKSIDDLEASLEKRYADELSAWTAQDLDDYEDYDGAKSDALKKIANNNNKLRSKPVKDPWSDDEFVKDEPLLTKKISKSPLSVDHLVSRKPAGGRGTMQDEESQQSSGFFFRQQSEKTIPKQAPVASNPDKVRVKPTASQPVAEPKPKVKRVKPLVDQNGNPLFLTTKQAQRNFAQLTSAEPFSNDDIAERKPTWEDLGVTHPQLLQNLEKMSCRQPLAVQSNSIPRFLDGQDVLVGTYTGSGKVRFSAGTE
jgi:hypothetical protein